MGNIIEEIYRNGIIPLLKNYEISSKKGFIESLKKCNLKILGVSFKDKYENSFLENENDLIIGGFEISSIYHVDEAIKLGCKFICIDDFNYELMEYVKHKKIIIMVNLTDYNNIEKFKKYNITTFIIKEVIMLENNKFKEIIDIYKDINFIIDLGFDDKNIIKYLNTDRIISCVGGFLIDRISMKNKNFYRVEEFIINTLKTSLDIQFKNQISKDKINNIENSIRIYVNNLHMGINYYKYLGFNFEDKLLEKNDRNINLKENICDFKVSLHEKNKYII